MDPFTGQSGYSITLGLIDTRGRVSFIPTLVYSGNNRLPSQDDNRTSSDAWLGIGWNLDLPSISRNHKGTYQNGDDIFYADMGTLGKGQLLRGASGTFYLADNPYLVFTPDSAVSGDLAGQFETWTVKLADGTRYTFGNRDSVESNSERVVFHVNGAVRASPYSIANTAAKPFIYRWDLQMISDAEQRNHLNFEWQKVSVDVAGNTTKKSTQESWLHRIRSLDGRNNEAVRWEFLVADKPADEYVKPNSTYPNPIQAPVSTKFLSEIRIYHGGTETANYAFTYVHRSSGKYRKRLLDEVRSANRLHANTGTFVNSPIWKCTYETGLPYNLLSIQKPSGGKTDFTYATAALGADAQQPAYSDANNRLKNDAGTVVAFPAASAWTNASSCSERFCFLVAKDGDKVGGKMYIEVRHNTGNYFDETGIYRKTYTAAGTAASNWKWASAGDYFVVYDANAKDVHLHEWNGLAWQPKFTADFGPISGTANPLSVHVNKNYFVATQAGNPLNKVWVYLRRGSTWNRLNAGTSCDIDNNTAYGEAVKNTGFGCLEFNSTLKVAVTDRFFTLTHDASDIFFAYALNRDGNAFANVSGQFLNFGDGVQHATFPNNWSQNVTQVVSGPDYLVIQSANATQQRIDVLHDDGVNFRRVTTSGWENGAGADLSIATEWDYFVTGNQSTGLIHLWRRTNITGGFNYTRTQVRTGVPARTAAKLSMRAFPEAFAFEYGRLGEELGGQPVPILEGSTDLSSWLYQVDPTATNGFRDRSPDIRYTVAGGTTKLFSLSITPDNLLAGVTMRNTSAQASVCQVGAACKPFFATFKVKRGETGTSYLAGVKAVPDITGPSLNKHISFRAARSGMLSWFDGTAQVVKFRLFAFDGDDYDAGPALVRIVTKVTEGSGVDQTSGSGLDLVQTLTYDQGAAEFNTHLQVPQFPLCTQRQVNPATPTEDNGRTEMRFDVDKANNRRQGRTLRLNGAKTQVQVFNTNNQLLSSRTYAYRTGGALAVPADWPATVSVNRLDNEVVTEYRVNGSKMNRKIWHHNYNNVNGKPHFTKTFQDEAWSINQTLFNGIGLPTWNVSFVVPYNSSQPSGPDLEAANTQAPLNTTQAVGSSKWEYDGANPYYKLKDHTWRDDGALTGDQMKTGTEPPLDLNRGWYLDQEVTRRNFQNQVEESRSHKTASTHTYSSFFYEGLKQQVSGSVYNAKLDNCAILTGESGDVAALSTADMGGRWSKPGVTFTDRQARSGRFGMKVTNNYGPTINLYLKDVRTEGYDYLVTAWIYRPTGSSSDGLWVRRFNSAGIGLESYGGTMVPLDPFDPPVPTDDRWEMWEVRISNAQLISGNLFNGNNDYLRVYVGTGAPGSNTGNAIYVDDIVCRPSKSVFNLKTYDYQGNPSSETDTRHKSKYPQVDHAGTVLGLGDDRYRQFGQGAGHRVGEN